MKNPDGLKIARLLAVGNSFGRIILLTIVFCNISATAQNKAPILTVPLKRDGQAINKTGKPDLLDDDKTTYWTMRDAIVAALAQSPDYGRLS